MNKSTHYNQQAKQCKSDVDEICIYQNRGKWPSPASNVLKINGFHARKNPPATIFERSHITFSEASFCKKCAYVYNHTAQIIH